LLEQEILLRQDDVNAVNKRLDEIDVSVMTKRLDDLSLWTEAQSIQQSALDRRIIRLEDCEAAGGRVQMSADAEGELRQRLEELQSTMENCLANEWATGAGQTKLHDFADTDAGGTSATRGGRPDATIHGAEVSREIAAVKERLASLELCVQESALCKQEQATSDMTLVADIKHLQLAIVTISNSMSNVAKDVLDLRRSSAAACKPELNGKTHGSSQQFKAEEYVSEWTAACNYVSSQSSANLSPASRSPGSRSPWDLTTARENTTSSEQATKRSLSPVMSKQGVLSSSLRENSQQLHAQGCEPHRFGVVRGALRPVPEDPQVANSGQRENLMCMTQGGVSGQSSLGEPQPADHESLQPHLPIKHWRRAHGPENPGKGLDSSSFANTSAEVRAGTRLHHLEKQQPQQPQEQPQPQPTLSTPARELGISSQGLATWGTSSQGLAPLTSR